MSESKLEHAYLNPLQLNISMHNLQSLHVSRVIDHKNLLNNHW